MASFHCSVKVGRTGSGGSHADYITRTGKYASKEKDDLEHAESGNLPEWAGSPKDFWRAADEHERANGTVYREFEIALPRELTPAQRLDMVREFICVEIGDRHAYTFAIHNPRATIEGGEQPHAHIMFSERQRDGIEREAAQYFKRWNAKAPERGGCQKANKAATPTQRKADLVKLRERFAHLQNRHLAKHGYPVTVTHLSLKAQGIDREAEPHLGPRVAAAVARDVQELRAIQVEPEKAPEPDIYDLHAQVRGQIDKLHERYWQAYSQAKSAEEVLNAHVKEGESRAQAIREQYQRMPPQPKLIGRKDWETQREALRTKFDALEKIRKEVAKEHKEAKERMDRLRVGLHRPNVEKSLLSDLSKTEPHLVKAYEEVNRLIEVEKKRQQLELQSIQREKSRSIDRSAGPSR